MYIQQKELFAGMDKEFIKEIMAVTVKKTYECGEVVFREGSHASRFYVLLKGRVRLTVGDGRHMVFTVNHADEGFGWSSLLGRSVYAASAICEEPTSLLRIHGVQFNEILDKDPVHGLMLIRLLARVLGHRLHEAYQVIGARMESFSSYGSGQIMEMIPPV